jgi:hypothetical protein
MPHPELPRVKSHPYHNNLIVRGWTVQLTAHNGTSTMARSLIEHHRRLPGRFGAVLIRYR